MGLMKPLVATAILLVLSGCTSKSGPPLHDAQGRLAKITQSGQSLVIRRVK